MSQLEEFFIAGRFFPRRRVGEGEAPLAETLTCASCAAPAGAYHQEGCTEEPCPVCAGRAYSCECDQEGDDEDGFLLTGRGGGS